MFHQLNTIGLPVEEGNGGGNKFNRIRLDVSKTHWIDAALEGKVVTPDGKKLKPVDEQIKLKSVG